jgi:glyoxylase-like metal-dependent hydrolase (beta-lactamase superfamily II)
VRQQQFNRISEHVYLLDPEAITDRPSLGVIVGKQSTLVVDAGNSPAHVNILVNELEKQCISKLDYVVLTHWHWDHVFGSSAFEAPIFAQEETTRKIREMINLDWSDEALDARVEIGEEIEFCRDMIKAEWPNRNDLIIKSPDVSFVDQLEFDLGDVRCQVRHVGGDHASDSSIIYIPEDRVMFLGDALYGDLHHGPENYTANKIYPLIDGIMRFKADYYVWSHDAEPMLQKDMLDFIRLLKKVGSLVQQAGANRELLLSSVKEILGQELTNEHLDIADKFLSGLQVSQKT